jgi:hypothetical protein
MSPVIRQPWRTGMLLAVLLLGAVPAGAAETEYELLIVACDPGNCQRIAAPRVAARAGQKSNYSQRNVKLEIETLAASAAEADANVRVEIVHADDRPAAAVRKTVLLLPCRVTDKALSSLATFAVGNVIYHVWAKIMPASVVAALR